MTKTPKHSRRQSRQRRSQGPQRLPTQSSDNHSRTFEIIPEDPKAPLPNLVNVQLSCMENVISDGTFRLRGVLTCGEETLLGSDAEYVVKLRNCFVDFGTADCSTDPFHSTLKYTQEPSVNIVSTEHTRHNKSADSSVGVGAGIAANRTSMLASFTAKAGALRSAVTSTQAEVEKSLRPGITLVQDTPRGIRVGDPLEGDPRNPNGTLGGKYLHDRPEQPLQVISIRPGARAAQVVAQVRVQFGQLRVERVGEREQIAVRVGDAYAADVERCLREAVRGLRVAKELRQRASLNLLGPNGSIVLAEHRLLFSNINDENGQ